MLASKGSVYYRVMDTFLVQNLARIFWAPVWQFPGVTSSPLLCWILYTTQVWLLSTVCLEHTQIFQVLVIQVPQRCCWSIQDPRSSMHLQLYNRLLSKHRGSGCKALNMSADSSWIWYVRGEKSVNSTTMIPGLLTKLSEFRVSSIPNNNNWLTDLSYLVKEMSGNSHQMQEDPKCEPLTKGQSYNPHTNPPH